MRMPVKEIRYLGLGFVALTGCATESPNMLRTVRTVPAGAVIKFDYSDVTCMTPCTIKVARPLRIILTKEGFEETRLFVEPGRGDIEVTLDLTAPAEPVDEIELPDL